MRADRLSSLAVLPAAGGGSCEALARWPAPRFNPGFLMLRPSPRVAGGRRPSPALIFPRGPELGCVSSSAGPRLSPSRHRGAAGPPTMRGFALFGAAARRFLAVEGQTRLSTLPNTRQGVWACVITLAPTPGRVFRFPLLVREMFALSKSASASISEMVKYPPLRPVNSDTTTGPKVGCQAQEFPLANSRAHGARGFLQTTCAKLSPFRNRHLPRFQK